MENTELADILEELNKVHGVSLREAARRMGYNGAGNLASARMGKRSQEPFLPKLRELLAQERAKKQRHASIQQQVTPMLTTEEQERNIEILKVQAQNEILARKEREARARLASVTPNKYELLKDFMNRQKIEAAQDQAMMVPWYMRLFLKPSQNDGIQNLQVNTPKPRFQIAQNAASLQQRSQEDARQAEIRDWEQRTGMSYRDFFKKM